MSGYLSGLSSPSVTERITTLAASPRSKAAGQTRLPTFSMNSSPPSGRTSRWSACPTICASRWHPLPVLIWMAGVPVARMRSASLAVCWSPSITATGVCAGSARRVRTSSVVLPEPGLETRFRPRMPRACSKPRFSAAWPLFLARMSRSIRTTLAGDRPGACAWVSPRPRCSRPCG